MNKKAILISIIFSCCFTLLAKGGESVHLSQFDSLVNTSKNIDFNSPVFNRDSIAKYNYDGYVHPLRSYLYPNNTGLTDDDLFEKYKLYQEFLKAGNKIQTKKIPYKIAMVAEFKRILGENPYDYIGADKYYLEYEITEILFDAYKFYKLGDKIKVYQDFWEEAATRSVSIAKYVFLNMNDKQSYDFYRFDENLRLEDTLVPILIDLYSTDFYIKLQDSIDVVDLHTIKELRTIYKDANQAKKEKSESLYWYEYDFESLLKKIDENVYIKDSK